MMALRALGLPLYLHALFVALAIWLVWRAFRTEDVKRQVLVLMTGTLLATPYALRYELGMLSPSLVDALLAGTARGLLIAVPLYCLNVFTIVPALVVSSIAASRESKS
jgi:predicted permease